MLGFVMIAFAAHDKAMALHHTGRQWMHDTTALLVYCQSIYSLLKKEPEASKSNFCGCMKATRALLTFNNNVEIAVGWLLRNTGAHEEGPSNHQATSSQEPDQAEQQEGEEQGDSHLSEVGDRRPQGEQGMAAQGSPSSVGEGGTGVDVEQLPQEGSVADTSQTPSEGKANCSSIKEPIHNMGNLNCGLSSA